MASENIPLILISAADSRAADSIISEIINSSESEVKDDKCVWVISNKYYSARVLLHPLLDGEPAPPPPDLQDRIEAHIILIENKEVAGGAGEDEAEAERRRVAAGALAACEVRLLVATCPCPSPALAAWARRHRYELVSLASPALASGEEDDEWEDEAGESGAARVVAALHAHTWRGLVLASRGGGTRVAATHEQFAALVGSVREAGERAAAMPREQRAHYAEHLVAAFCRALANDHDHDNHV